MTILKGIKLAAILWIGARTAAGQEAWSLERCIAHALANNLQIKMERINRESRAIDLHTARHSWLPDLNANIGEDISFGRATSRDNTLIDKTSANTSFGVSASMPLFTGFQISNNIKNRQYAVMAAEEALKKAQEDIAVSVAQAFLDVLLRKEILKINTETLFFTLENVKKTEIMAAYDRVPLAQLYEIKAQYASDEARVTAADNDVALGLLTLGQLLELASLGGFDISAPRINDTALALGNIPAVEGIFGTALGIKPQIRSAELTLEGGRAALKAAEGGHYPQLNLQMGIGNGFYSTENVSAADQMRQNMREYIGLSLQIPIFNRFSIQNNVKQARIGIAQQQLTLDIAKKTLYKEIQQAYHNAVARQKSFRAAQKSVEAAREAFRYADTRYQTGKSSVYEFTEAKTTLVRALSEEAQAKYSYVFAVKILDFYAGIPISL